MRKFAFVIPVVLLAAGATGCATKKFVRGEVGTVNGKVEGLSDAGRRDPGADPEERGAHRRGRHEGRRGGQVGAGGAAGCHAGRREGRLRQGPRLEAVETASRRLVYEVVLSEDQGNFKFGKAELPDQAKARIDEMVNQLKADPKGIYIEIEGHTDAVGGTRTNDQLGLQRAEAVKRYLYEAHQVPLHKINAISFGEEKPVAPNNTRQGRAQNRRVVIKVLA